jgi:hypothetical protein
MVMLLIGRYSRDSLEKAASISCFFRGTAFSGTGRDWITFPRLLRRDRGMNRLAVLMQSDIRGELMCLH